MNPAQVFTHYYLNNAACTHSRPPRLSSWKLGCCMYEATRFTYCCARWRSVIAHSWSIVHLLLNIHMCRSIVACIWIVTTIPSDKWPLCSVLCTGLFPRVQDLFRTYCLRHDGLPRSDHERHHLSPVCAIDWLGSWYFDYSSTFIVLTTSTLAVAVKLWNRLTITGRPQLTDYAISVAIVCPYNDKLVYQST